MGSSRGFAPGAANLHSVGRGRARFLATGGCWSSASSFGKPSSPVHGGCGTRRSRRGRPTRWLSTIPAGLTNEIRELARRTGVTFFSALLGAFQIAFSEWSGFDDLVVGTPVANRAKQTARETMGYYAGIVPLRGQIDRSRVVG